MSLVLRICALVAAAVLFCPFQATAAPQTPTTYREAADQATATLLDVFYAGGGLWRDCNDTSCNRANGDWGDDSATYTLFLRWRATHDSAIRTVMSELVDTARRYPAPCSSSPCAAWSDTPAWDAVTLMREYEVLGDSRALDLAKAALAYAAQSKAFSGGACPAIPYQEPQPGAHHVKTLETDANEIKAALLLFRATSDRGYLQQAQTLYAADRLYYWDSAANLYSVHVIDDGAQCTQVARRYFASVNGDMIWNGLELSHLTGEQHYYDEALTTAHAVDVSLSDGRGIFADLQGENDVVEPLVEAMYDLASDENLTFAREWILRNAGAALSGRAPDGTFSRFFDGPWQTATSVWESNGGLALQIAAAALAPEATPSEVHGWKNGRFVGDPVTTLPATIQFDGSGIALIGTIGEECQRDHVRVFIDGVETFDQTGLWQNSNMPKGDSVLFAWRWPETGTHTITLEPGDPAQTGRAVADLRSFVIGVK